MSGSWCGDLEEVSARYLAQAAEDWREFVRTEIRSAPSNTDRLSALLELTGNLGLPDVEADLRTALDFNKELIPEGEPTWH